MTPPLRRRILALVKRHRILTLATLRADGWPQATTVTYANDGLTLYVMVAADSQKARNIRRDPRVSLTIDRDYDDWNRIRGLSMAAVAEVVADDESFATALAVLSRKFPQFAAMTVPEDIAGAAILRIRPKLVSLLDYTRGFGHSDLLRV